MHHRDSQASGLGHAAGGGNHVDECNPLQMAPITSTPGLRSMNCPYPCRLGCVGRKDGKRVHRLENDVRHFLGVGHEGRVARRNRPDGGFHALCQELLRRWGDHLIIRAHQVPRRSIFPSRRAFLFGETRKAQGSLHGGHDGGFVLCCIGHECFVELLPLDPQVSEPVGRNRRGTGRGPAPGCRRRPQDRRRCRRSSALRGRCD